MFSNVGTIAIPGEHDDYENISLVAGHTYYLELVGNTYADPALSDPILKLLLGSSTGTLVASDDNGGAGLDSRIVFHATQTGSYTADVAGQNGATGNYHLLVNEDDYKGTVDGLGSRGHAIGSVTYSIEGNGAFGALDTGGTATGSIDYTTEFSNDPNYLPGGDADLFAVSLLYGLTYNFEMRGQYTGEGTLYDPVLDLLDSNGHELANSDDALTTELGSDSLITYTAPAFGTYYLEAHEWTGDDTGTYQLRASVGVGTVYGEVISGLASNDAIDGAGGNDTLYGGAGNDTLIGNVGNDTLRGQGGSDRLHGGPGTDILIGGTGNDVFDFNTVGESHPGARDVVRAGDGAAAFEGAENAAGDTIDLSGLDANLNASGNQGFKFGGTGTGHLWLTTSGSDTIVHANNDGDAAADFELVIADGSVAASAYRAVDFIL